MLSVIRGIRLGKIICIISFIYAFDMLFICYADELRIRNTGKLINFSVFRISLLRGEISLHFLSSRLSLLASGGKTAPHFQGDRLDRLASRMLLHLLQVRGARGTCCKASLKNGFHACASQALQRRFIKLCEKTDTIGGSVFFCGNGGMGPTGRPHAALKSFEGTSTRRIRIIERRELSMPKLVC